MSDGKFGPFAGQMFSADQNHSNIGPLRPAEGQGRYQGVCIPFREGFASGIVPMMQAADGSLFVGGTNRGWGSVGPKPFALERLVWTGKTAFEILDMKLTPDGFDLTFTEPVDTATAAEAEQLRAHHLPLHLPVRLRQPRSRQDHLHRQVGHRERRRVKVHLVVDGLQQGAVHELHVPNLRSKADAPLLHPVAYYTLWNFVESEK